MKIRLLVLSAAMTIMTGMIPETAFAADRAGSPWGIAAHPQRDMKTLPLQLQRCREAGITWLREDFSFGHVAAKKGEYHFELYDQIVNECAKTGIQVLPILQGYDWESARPDVVPLYKHPEEWRGYVRATVQRYHDRLKYWEIWNEPDGGFWKPEPNAGQYVSLLKIAYREIKAIDPECKVILGGISPNYLKEIYQCGGKGYFDAIATHPYGWGLDRNEYAVKMMVRFRSLIAANHDTPKEFWMTECGASTFASPLPTQQPYLIEKAIRLALQKINRPCPPDKKPVVGAIVPQSDPDFVFDYERTWLPGIKIVPVNLDKLKTLSPEECPVLIGAESISTEEPCVVPLRDYVQRGGVMLAFGVGCNEVPFYSMIGRHSRFNGAADMHPFFRIGFEAWWTAGIPEICNNGELTPAMANLGCAPLHGVSALRLLSSKNIGPSGEYTPLIQFKDKNRVLGEGLALYTFKDWKGAILACTTPLARGVTEEQQANLLQCVYLTYLADGASKIFLYDLRDDGDNPNYNENRFGILRTNGNPKPSFEAYREMTAALGKTPVFQTRLPAAGDPEHKIWALVFKRSEDGGLVLACWACEPQLKYTITNSITSKTTACIGEKVSFIKFNAEPQSYRIAVQP